MTEEIQENIDSQNDELEIDPVENNQQEDETNDDDSKDEMSPEVKQLLARVKKAEAKNKKLREALADDEEETPQKQNINKETNSSDLDERFERLELKGDGYTKDEIDYIMKNGGQSALEDPYIKKTIDVMRDERQSDDAVPDAGAKSAVYKKYTHSDIKGMSEAELEKIIPRED